MRRNGRFKIGAACALVCLALAGGKGATFNGSRLGNEDQYVLEYTQFNTTDSQNLELESGTYTITVTGEKAKGSVSFTVEKDAN